MTTIRNLLLVLQVFMCQDSVSAYDPVALGLNMSQGMATFQDLTPVNGGTYFSIFPLSLSRARFPLASLSSLTTTTTTIKTYIFNNSCDTMVERWRCSVWSFGTSQRKHGNHLGGCFGRHRGERGDRIFVEERLSSWRLQRLERIVCWCDDTLAQCRVQCGSSLASYFGGHSSHEYETDQHLFRRFDRVVYPSQRQHVGSGSWD